MLFSTLISVDALCAHLNQADLVVFDCRHDLMDPDAGARAYAQGHVPGARFAHADRDLAGPKTGRNGRHPLPEPAVFMRWLGDQGVTPSTQVVGYDWAAGASAARLWWMLKWVGHQAAAVLDGGWETWTTAGAPVTAKRPEGAPTRYSGRAQDGWVDAQFLLGHLEHPDVAIVDARSAERFRGEAEPIDPVAGRIPGARNRPYKENLGSDGRFKPAAELRAAFEALLTGVRPEQVVHQCGSGVSACHNLLAMEIAGLTGSRLYPGSWSEWCSDPVRPIARGPHRSA